MSNGSILGRVSGPPELDWALLGIGQTVTVVGVVCATAAGRAATCLTVVDAFSLDSRRCHLHPCLSNPGS